MSHKRFSALESATHILDHTIVWTFENSIGEAGAKALYDGPFDPANTSRNAYADRLYPSVGREAWLKESDFRNQIQRKGHRNKPLSDSRQRHNQRIAKTRANFAMTMMAALLEPEAAGLLSEGRNQGLLTLEVGRFAAARGESRQRRGKTAAICRGD